MNYKIRYLGTIAGALIAISIVVWAIGDSRWQTKSDAQQCKVDTELRLQKIEQDATEYKTDVKWIKESMTEIKAKLDKQ